jgi:hypothetical protein
MGILSFIGVLALWFVGTLIISYATAVIMLMTLRGGLEAFVPPLYAFCAIWALSIAGLFFWMGSQIA